MSDFGFKRLTTENWLLPDEASTIFVNLSTGETVTADERAQSILKPTLLDSVPLPIRRLFEVARGALLYGYFFYPLYALAGEQLYRLVETAINEKCKSFGIRTDQPFRGRLERLIQNGLIPEQERQLWMSLWAIRNATSHPSDQMLHLPVSVIGNLWYFAEKINNWFGSQPSVAEMRDGREGEPNK